MEPHELPDDTPIDESGISIRALLRIYNLAGRKLTTVGEIRAVCDQASDAELLSLPSFGLKCLAEVRAVSRPPNERKNALQKQIKEMDKQLRKLRSELKAIEQAERPSAKP